MLFVVELHEPGRLPVDQASWPDQNPLLPAKAPSSDHDPVAGSEVIATHHAIVLRLSKAALGWRGRPARGTPSSRHSYRLEGPPKPPS
jgi:hypothetical protein